MAEDDGTVESTAGVSTTSDEGTKGGDQHHYLLVFEAQSSFMYPLPASGEVEIGRQVATGLKLEDNSVSRRHAKLVFDDGVTLVDLGSQNGTRINGERVQGSRRLASADMITIGGATLIYHADQRADVTNRVLEFAEFRRRLDEEIERVLRFKRAFGMLCLALRDPGIERAERAQVDDALQRQLRKLDVYAWSGNDEVLILLPETGTSQTPTAARRLCAALEKVSPSLHIGYTVCPDDGCGADGLIANLRTATLASTKQISPVDGGIRTIAIGSRTVIVADAAMVRLYAMIERLATADLPVLFMGETGTGKEIAATAIHVRSPRAARPLVTLNCAAIAETLAESELFGYERGAFSGAVAAKPGLFESAAGGTVFLDEIGELSASTQAKLLRALEVKRITRLGDVREREVDFRLVAATNRDLLDEVEAGRFRSDLYFRLGGAVLQIPPLRERTAELPALAETFLAEACARLGRETMKLSPSVVAILRAHSWPGNLRELKNLMDYVAAAFADPVVEPSHVADRLRGKRSEQPAARQRETASVEPRAVVAEATYGDAPAAPPARSAAPRSLADEIAELEKRRIVEALAAHHGNHAHAARSIGMPLRTFFSKVKKYAL